MLGALQNFEESSNMPKIWQKKWRKLAFKPIIRPNIRFFGYPINHYNRNTLLFLNLKKRVFYLHIVLGESIAALGALPPLVLQYIRVLFWICEIQIKSVFMYIYILLLIWISRILYILCSIFLYIYISSWKNAINFTCILYFVRVPQLQGVLNWPKLCLHHIESHLIWSFFVWTFLQMLPVPCKKYVGKYSKVCNSYRLCDIKQKISAVFFETSEIRYMYIPWVCICVW